MAGRPKKTEAEKEQDKQRKKINRLRTIKHKLETGSARDLQEILDDYPISSLATDLMMAFATLKRKTDNPKLFSGEEKRLWAALIEVDYIILRDFIEAEIKRMESK